MRLRTLLPMLLLLACSALANTVITFDDLPQVSGGALLPQNYAGLHWDDWGYDSPKPGLNGYYTSLLSPSNIAFNLSGGLNVVISSSTPFTPVSANFAAAFDDGMTITVDATLFGAPVGSLRFLANTTSASFENFDFGPVTELIFGASGGTLNPNTDFCACGGGPSDYFGMDNFAIATPEPSGFAELAFFFMMTLLLYCLIAMRRASAAHL